MHIKQITISNFRSFRQQPEIQAFSPATNSVIGRNGSGKSNLFDAVQFVLIAPRFANLRQEERQALLHEGSGAAAVNAFCELVFDNADHRFAINSDEVVLRRTVGAKKDEFFLQRKRATKQEVQSLLEGAGFSKSNPYFIVQQGKVQDLCTIQDNERLRLLMEVAGTVVYDEKKSESLLKMQENDDSRQKVNEILTDIEERLGELQSEKEELTAYQSLDRGRRAVEYTVYDKELTKARTVLDALEHERADHVEQVSEWHDAAKTSHDAIRNMEGVLKTKAVTLRRNRMLTTGLEDDMKETVRRCTQLELECGELQESLQTGAEQEQRTKKELKRLQVEIAKTQKELAERVQPNHDEAVRRLHEMTVERDQAAREIESLYAKQGRGRQFGTKEERDAFLQGNIQELVGAKADKESELAGQQDSLSNLRRTLDKEIKDLKACTKEALEQSNALQSLTKTVDEKKRLRLELHEERKEYWRKAEGMQEQVREARENVHRAVSDIRKSMPRATAMGLEALQTIVEQERLVVGKEYFGMLMDNMELKEEKFQTAVEVAAQNSLFHVIVDTDHTAARLMGRLEAGKLGRVTFLPLNQLRTDTSVQYPNSKDVRPLLDLCISYDPKVERAMQHVFSKKLLARSPEVASEWSAKLSMDAITLDGDLCSRRGALTGGYVDVNKSRLRAHARHQSIKAALEDLDREYTATNRKTQEIDHAATNLMQEIQVMEAKHSQLSHATATKDSEIERLEQRVEQHTKQIERAENTTIPLMERSIETVQGDIARLEMELGTELVQSLSEEDRERLNMLKAAQEVLVPNIEAQSEVVAQSGVERQKLQSFLEDNLLKRRSELIEGNAAGMGDHDTGTANDDDLSITAAGGTPSSSRRRSSRGRLSLADLQLQRKDDLADLQQQLKDAVRIKDELDNRLAEARRVEDELRGELITAKNELEQLKSQDMKNLKLLEEAQDKSERLLNKRAMCISKRETYMRKIQELGSLPPPAELEKHRGKSIGDLMKNLETVNKKLKKYSHVNKKAYDQYVNFSEQRDSLLRRKEELDQGADKVKELIESLDLQKDEAINRTFRGVSAHFKDVFKELVPNGAGELILRTAVDESGETDQEEDSNASTASAAAGPKNVDPKNPDVSLYRGIGIKVRFSEVGENFMMSQLSGGQKALVALALIFAIQRCDPAPFYLFDELDQALDSSYRAAVANVIQRQANNKENPTQFIVSTFRPELVAVANRCYGISHQNKVSSLHHLTKKDALHFISNLMNEEEAVGDVTSLSTSRTSRFARKRKSSTVGTEDDEDETITVPFSTEGKTAQDEDD